MSGSFHVAPSKTVNSLLCESCENKKLAFFVRLTTFQQLPRALPRAL